MKIYYKSTCITCKNTIKKMEQMTIDVEKRDFFKDPFSKNELKEIITMTGKKPLDLLRKRDKMYKSLDFDKNKKTDDEIIDLMLKHPGLILRPIVIIKNKALVGKLDDENIH